MNRHTVAVLVKNRSGVLNRVTSMFRRRQFNISSLAVSETETEELSRITVVFSGEETRKQQLIDQLHKLPDVFSIKELTADDSISRELLLIKMRNEVGSREEIRDAADAFGATIVDYSKDHMIFHLADTTGRLDDFLDLMSDHTILEVCRTGTISIEKGSSTIRQTVNL